MVKKKTFITTVSYMSAVIIALCGFALKQKSKSGYCMSMIENMYSCSFEQLNCCMNYIS